MFRRVLFVALLAASLVSCTAADDVVVDATPPPPEPIDAVAAVTDASAAMGADGVDSITISGTAWNARNGFMQMPSASPPWPLRDTMTDYVLTIDLTQPALRATADTFAEDIFFHAATEGNYTLNANADSGWGQQMEIWLSPWGFLQGAAANGAEGVSQVMDGNEYSVVTWTAPVASPGGPNYMLTGYINSDGMVARVETHVENNLAGDLLVENVYSNYQDVDGVMVPMTMEQHRAGGALFGVDATAATVNPENVAELVTPPPPAAGGRGGRGGGGGGGGDDAPASVAEQLGEGVYLLHTAYQSLVVEFADYVVVFESGAAAAVGEQILGEVAVLFPDKEIRYLITSHPHSDHTGGVVPFVRAGVTILTQEDNVDFLTRIFSNPRTLLGEATMNPSVEGVGDMMILEDDTNRLELYHVPNGHTDGMLIAFHPGTGVLLQADFTLTTLENPFVIELAERIEELGLEFDQYVGVHASGSPETQADLVAAAEVAAAAIAARDQ
jgi:glyoxylase-like metal-dependent hydrolase (beta-lactamase superfamily II)